MPFLGNTPSNTFVSITKQSITGNGGTVYGLAQSVTNAADLDVYVNNIRQEPYVAYNASGTVITFTDAIASTDSVYWLFNGQTVGTLSVPSNSVGVGQLNTTEVDARYVNTTGDTINGTLTVKDSTGVDTYFNVSSTGKVTTPAQPCFSSGFSTSYTQLSGVRDVQFNYKNFEVGTNFNTSTYRFTAPVAGKYLFSAFVGSNGGASANTYFGIGFVVNGSSQGLCWYNSSSGYQKDAIIQLLNLSANDYVLVHMEVQNNTTLNTGNFSGYLLG